MVSTQKRVINSICYREYHSAGVEAAIPSLLVNPTDSTVTLYKYAPAEKVTREKNIVQLY